MDEKSLRILEFDKVLDRLAGYTSFSASETLAREVRPTTDEGEARRWQWQTHEARLLLDLRTDVHVGAARDVRRPADNAMRGFILQPEDLLAIRATISAGRELRRKLERTQDNFPHLWAIGELIEDCPGVVTAIGNTLDERGEVLDSASDRLATIRRQLRVAHGRIQEKLRTLLNSSQNEYLQEPTITTRGGRYVVPLKANYKGRIRGIVHDQSNTGATLWIEPLNTVELNNEFRSLQLAEEEEIQRILAELSAIVAVHGEAIKRIVERLAELDLVFARARYASVTRAVRPEFVPWRSAPPPRAPKHANQRVKEPLAPSHYHPGSTIWVRHARHPLLDPETVVPTDLLLDEETYLVLITGPNTGGKTVSLKTTGLMVLMAQAGLHLPAVEAQLSVFEKVFADIGDEQSIEQNLSTFSAHLTNIVHILAEVDDRSLVLLDELGSGTDPAEGAALAQAIVSYLRDKGATTFVATHFPELKVYASQTPGATNASLLFDVETLMPTYEMSIGMPGRSNAFAIARRLGLEETILDEALQMVGASSHKAESLLDTIYEMREKITSQEAGARLALKQAEEERDRLRQRLEKIEAERQQILAESRRQGEVELEAMRDELNQMRKKLRDTESLNQLKKLQKQTEEIEEAQQKVFEAEAATEPESRKLRRKSKELRVGDTVLVTTLGARGEIIDLDGKEAEVVVGRLRTRVRLEELEFKGREEEEETLPIGRPAAESPGMELDLRGKRVEDGLQELERYLDSAFLAHLPWVRIIHGKGTGRMREAVREALQQSEHVTSWEEGRDGEGGAGVTVAKFNVE
ncbi:MAG: Smr/MutS family protein [Chloroflexi bacterium]|nr:Smr/MutS family protein [Chloroflexota bacterium]MCI0575961.1 Smr/MutS family protein [Chloroflexota bacterium]MCI0649393.1 Smr/MutS family protein [Chloroflexota bacterium]MCI0727074.1 Smr/MutS family protein [Chloroflexota bacterium]